MRRFATSFIDFSSFVQEFLNFLCLSGGSLKIRFTIA